MEWIKSADSAAIRFGETAEEGEVGFAADNALEVKRGFAKMVIAPHAGLAAWHLAAGWNVIPTVRTVVDGVQQEALMTLGRGEICLAQ